MFWPFKSWRCWIAVLILLAPASLLAVSMLDPGRILCARHGIVAALNPRGALWIFWGTTRTSVAETIIYDTGGMDFIVTHMPDGTAAVRAFGTGSREIHAVASVERSVAGRTQGYSFCFSLWWNTLAVALIATWQICREWVKRPRHFVCRSCDYSRVGLAADAACPECGAAGAAA